MSKIKCYTCGQFMRHIPGTLFGNCERCDIVNSGVNNSGDIPTLKAVLYVIGGAAIAIALVLVGIYVAAVEGWV